MDRPEVVDDWEALDGEEPKEVRRRDEEAEAEAEVRSQVDDGAEWSPPFKQRPGSDAEEAERKGGRREVARLRSRSRSRSRSPPVPAPARSPGLVDRPVLLVNWTAATGGLITRARLLDDTVDHAAWDDLRRLVVDDFNIQSELLFEQRHAVHSTELRWEADAARLAQLHPRDHFGALSYPTTVADGVVDVDEAWADLMRPSPFAVVTAVKQVLSQSSHTLLWKVLMAEELEELAAWQKAGQRETPASDPVADPAASAAPSSDAFDSGRLSVLDKSLAMILDRMPQFQPDRVHVEDTARRHMILKQMWIREFGGLPVPKAS